MKERDKEGGVEEPQTMLQIKKGSARMLGVKSKSTRRALHLQAWPRPTVLGTPSQAANAAVYFRTHCPERLVNDLPCRWRSLSHFSWPGDTENEVMKFATKITGLPVLPFCYVTFFCSMYFGTLLLGVYTFTIVMFFDTVVYFHYAISLSLGNPV